MKTTIRLAEASDARSLAELARSTFVETFGHTYEPKDLNAFLEQNYTSGRFQAALAKTGNRIWIAEQRGEAVGFAQAGARTPFLPVPEPGARDGEIKRLYLLARAQGNGSGTKLLLAALKWLNTSGYCPVYLSVWEENYGAQRLYQRHGFYEVGAYLFPVGEHMDRELIYRRDA